jgi:hypothetical protein
VCVISSFAAILLTFQTAAHYSNAETPKAQKPLKYRVNAIVVEIAADGTQNTIFQPKILLDEGLESSVFVGQEILLPDARGVARSFLKGNSLKIQATAAEKKRIHVGGLFELKHPIYDQKGQPHDGSVGTLRISEVVLPGETLKVKMDLTNENGKEYRVEIQVEEIEEKDIGS